jgi:hypothetical protein
MNLALSPHPLLCYQYVFSPLFHFLSLLTSSFAARYCLLANVHSYLSLKGPLGPAIDSNDSNDTWWEQEPYEAIIASVTPHIVQWRQLQHPYGVMLAATKPTQCDTSGHNTHAAQWQCPQHHIHCNGSNCKTKHNAIYFRLVGVIYAYRLA